MLTLDHWTPIRELDRMERRMRRLFEDVGFLPPIEPAADIYETEKELVFELEVPGFDEKELAIELSDHALVVTGEHEQEAEKAEQDVLLQERLERRFTRRFVLPAEADGAHVSASCEKGVLTLRVPKTASPKPRTIQIKPR